MLALLLGAVTQTQAEEATPATAAETEAVKESTSEAEDSADNDREKKPGKLGGYRLLPVPIIITEPAIGKGLGVALALFHPVKSGQQDETRLATLESMSEYSTPRQAPPVVTGVAGAYTVSGTWLGAIGHTNNWKNDSIRYAGVLALANVNSEIYVANVPLNFSMESTVIYQDLKFRIKGSDFLIGAAVSYMDAENVFGLGLPEGPGDWTFDSKFKNVGLAGKFAYETRDNSMNPRSGQVAELNVWRYDDALGGDYDYWAGKIKGLSFHSLTDRLTLGLRLELAGVDGKVPFFAIPYVKLRGIPALRYQNKFAGAAEVELRYRLRPRWEVSAFGGLGYTSDDYRIYDNPDSIYNFGFGGKYNVFQEQNVWAGIDIARGPEDWSWYIQVGHPW